MLKGLKWIGIVVAILLVLPVAIVMGIKTVNGILYDITVENGVQEELYVDMNGIEQFIAIRGENNENPIMIVLHGGPGFPTYSSAYYYQTHLEDDYTIVHWDQRGSGRTFLNDANFSLDDATPEQLVQDLDVLVDYLRDRFNQEKVILMGQSYGTAIGTRYVMEFPEKVSDYIAVGYYIDDYWLEAAEKALAIAKNQGNDKNVEIIEDAIKSYSSSSNISNFDSVSMDTINSKCTKYLSAENEMSFTKMVSVILASPYITMDDITWLSIVRNFPEGMKSMQHLMYDCIFAYDANELGYDFEVPLYIIQGDSDWITPTDHVEEYFSKVSAPDKGIAIMESSGHNPQLDNPEKFAEIVKDFLEKNSIGD